MGQPNARSGLGPPIVVLYARVSSKEQEKEGFSISAQLHHLRTYAIANNLPVAKEFVDVETAKQAGRAGFNEMIQLLKHSVDRKILLVEKTDRLYRNIKDWVTLDDLQPEIHFVKENVVLSAGSRSSEKFVHGMKVLMAKNYIDNLSEETRKGMDEKARRGIWPSYAPIGYRNVVDVTGKKGIEIDPEVGPKVTEIYQWYSTGLYSLSEITKKAKVGGIAFRGSRSFIPRATIHKVLRNVIYTGDFEWKGTRYHGSHTPLVDKDLWAQVQTVLATRLARRVRKVRREFAYSGLIRCGRCGCAFVGEIKKNKYVYYHCTGYRGSCGDKYTREAELDALFGDLLRHLHLDSDVLDWISNALMEDAEGERRVRKANKERVQEQVKRLQSRIDSMYIDKLDAKITSEFFECKKFEWETEQYRLQKALQGLNQSDPESLIQGQHLLRVISKIPELFEAQPPAEKRRLLNFVLSNSIWNDGKLSTDFRQPFDLFMDASLRLTDGSAIRGDGNCDFEKWLPGLDSN